MDQRPTVAELTDRIAHELGEDWRSAEIWRGVETLAHAALLNHPDGRALHLSKRWGEPGFLHIRGAFFATDYPFRRGDRDSLRVAMTDDPAAIAARIAVELIPRHRVVHEKVVEHNKRVEQLRRDVEALARDIAERLPGALTRIDGTTAFVALALDPGQVRIGIDGPAVNLVLNDVPNIIADAVVFAVSRFLPHIQTPDSEHGRSADDTPTDF